MIRKIIKFRAQQVERAPKICFVHVPKCGGASISRAIAQSYSYWNRLIVPNWYISLRASQQAADLAGHRMMDLREIVLIYKLAERRTKFISGHIVCRPTTREAFDRQWHFVTVLRDPVKRWVSQFVYDTYGAQQWNRNTLPIDQYLDSPSGTATARTYVEYFSMWRPAAATIGECDVEAAVENLGRFSVVGFLEELPAFAADIERKVGLRVRIPRGNVSPRPDVTSEIMDRTDLMARIRELCKWDIAVYDRVKSRERPRNPQLV